VADKIAGRGVTITELHAIGDAIGRELNAICAASLGAV
jgi:hypothetical protein